MKRPAIDTTLVRRAVVGCWIERLCVREAQGAEDNEEARRLFRLSEAWRARVLVMLGIPVDSPEEQLIRETAQRRWCRAPAEASAPGPTFLTAPIPRR